MSVCAATLMLSSAVQAEDKWVALINEEMSAWRNPYEWGDVKVEWSIIKEVSG